MVSLFLFPTWKENMFFLIFGVVGASLAENPIPSWSNLYQDFKARAFSDASGFDIVSFAVERNKESWLAAVMEDQLSWPYHLVSTDLFNDPAIKAYNVRQIPTKFLINPDGIIIAVDPSLDRVREILEEK